MSFQHHHSHHHHQSHRNPLPPPPLSCNSNSIYTSNCCCSSFSSPSPQQPDSNQQQLLQTLTSLLLLQTQPQPQPQSQTQTLKLHQPIYPKSPNPTPNFYRPSHDNNASLLHSLLRRVSLLESSLSDRRDPAPSVSHSRPKRSSVRHLAASTIQRYFRSFLVRRSRTLRDLKELAVIKSSVAGLRANLGDRNVRNSRAVLKEVEELMFKLDFIQSSDVMIREGKRSIRKELTRISEFVEKVLLREQKEEAAELKKIRDRVTRVSFKENSCNEDKFYDDTSERISEEETHLRNLGLYNQSSDSDESPKGRHGGLEAPVPVTMESRRNGFMKKVATQED